MDGKQFQSLTEVYKSVYQSQEDLQEYSAFIGGGIGPGGSRHVTVRGGAGGAEGGVTVQSKKGKDTDAATKASVTNAVADVQNKERSDAIASRSATTAAAKSAASPKISPKAQGAAALGGPLGLSSAQKADAIKPSLPAAAAKVSEPQERRVTGVSADFKYSGSVGSSKPTPKPTPTTSKTKPTPVRTPDKKPVPTDGRKLEPVRTAEPVKTAEPVRVKNPSIEFSRKEPPKDLGRGRDTMTMDTTSDLDTYNLVLEYLIGEGFASTEEAADKIILNMSEAWFESIVEDVCLGK